MRGKQASQGIDLSHSVDSILYYSCKAVFVDTDTLPARDSRVGDLVQNTTEAELVRQFTVVYRVAMGRDTNPNFEVIGENEGPNSSAFQSWRNVI